MAAAALGLFLAVGTGTALASEQQALPIENGNAVEVSEHLWTVNGETFAPVKELADRMGWQLAYEPESGLVTVSNGMDDTLSFQEGTSSLEFNGSTYGTESAAKLKDGDMYFPLRLLAEAMNANVTWNEERKAAVIQPQPEYVVAEGDTLWSLAEDQETTPRELMLRNGLPDINLQIGQQLKLVVPEFLDPNVQAAAKAQAEVQAKVAVAREVKASEAEPEIDAEDLALLAKLVQVESGYEPYEGKLAVANVVLNRVKTGRYSDTVKGVIYAPGQFPPATNGTLAKTKASEDSIKAAKAALSGENNVPGAVYFFNPQREPGKLKSLTKVKQIGHHVFAK
ncbi:cell wall hydrolase [Cohnella zeiphila]|uniref:Cell wall hydrolase n=1 Tax=Cohnella zeiphila TaxID=2761120 RepID=A0A7X0SH28_9BACL|nr:cell wall hydrolase [Cohnella zeiphila]MBB6729860.1 cell wall hydrolase [Cohnella zeiphila]